MIGGGDEVGSGDGDFMRGIIEQLQEPLSKKEPLNNVHVEPTSLEDEFVEPVNNTLLITRTTLQRVEHVTINETDQVLHLTSSLVFGLN